MPGGAYVPASFVGVYAPLWSALASGRIHRDKRRRDVFAIQFSSAFAGQRPMGTDSKGRGCALGTVGRVAEMGHFYRAAAVCANLPAEAPFATGRRVE